MPFILFVGLVHFFSELLQVSELLLFEIVALQTADKLEPFFDVMGVDILVFVENLLNFGYFEYLLFVTAELGLGVVLFQGGIRL